MRRSKRILRVAVAAAVAGSVLLSEAGLAYGNSTLPAAQSEAASGNVGTKVYKYKAGMDACTSVFNSQTALSAWWTYSPFYVYGMYLGGITATKQGCRPISTANLNYAAGLGWAFMPIWYGPQVPQSCGSTVATDYISLDPATAYQQGVNEANLAASAAAAIGFNSLVVITYDLEAEGHSNATCRAAAQAFIKGWDNQMNNHTLYYGGLYGGTSAISFADFVPSAITYQPWTIWPWYPCCYTTVYGLPNLPNYWWSQDQRYHQLAKPGTRTYGGVSASIDEDCADTTVASNNTLVPGSNNCNYY